MRIYITLDSDERKILGELARRNLRHPKDQLRYLLRCEAARMNLLPTNGAEQVKSTTEQTEHCPLG